MLKASSRTCTEEGIRALGFGENLGTGAGEEGGVGRLTHVGVGLGHEGEDEAERVPDGGVRGTGRGFDGAEEDRVDGGRRGGGGALD